MVDASGNSPDSAASGGGKRFRISRDQFVLLREVEGVVGAEGGGGGFRDVERRDVYGSGVSV